MSLAALYQMRSSSVLMSYRMSKSEEDYRSRSSEQRPSRVVLHYWGRRGGGSLLTLLLAQHLKTVCPPIEVVFSLSRGNRDITSFEATGLPILFADLPNLVTLWREGWLLSKQLRAHADHLACLKPDAVIMTMNSPFAWPFMGMLQRRGLKVIYVAHDAAPHPGDYAATWQRWTQDRLIKEANRIVALSKSVATRIGSRVPAATEKISVVPLEAVYPSKRARLPDWLIPGEPVRLLFYGRLLPYKGLNCLAQALAPLKARPGWLLTIAGAGPLEADVKEMFSGWPQVDLELGWVSDQRTSELFSEHHLLLCPYMEASQSGVIAEALSWAMPSIVMPMGALPEQIGFGAAGLVTEGIDADAFRRRIESILEQPESLRELSNGAAALLKKRQANRGWIELVDHNGL